MNKRGFAHIRVGHAEVAHALHKRDSCATGGLYTNPTMGMVMSSANPVNITWDTSCLPGTTAVDIYLIASGLTNSRIHEWQSVNFALGSYQTTLQPSWWNGTSSMALQFSIVSSGTPPFLSPFPAGPVFNATTSGSTAAGTSSTNSAGVTYVNNFPVNKSLSKGKIAAGLLFPIFIIAIGVYIYIRFSRARGKKERRRFSEAVDKRMSTISSDWKSITAAGASAAIRNSIAVSTGNRSSAFTFGAIRPTSTMVVEGDPQNAERLSIDTTQLSQLRPSIRASAFGERVSRVSFAADVRPSADSRRTTTTSRVFRSSLASSYIPPLPIPAYPIQSDTSDISPTQTKGAFALTSDDIAARIETDNAVESLTSMEEVWPSLSMMRTGGENDVAENDNYLLPQRQSIDLPMPPFPVHPAPEPLPSGMTPVPDNMMSPDDMLRAYATRKITSPPTSPIAFPARTLSIHGSSIRNLYTPTTPAPSSPTPDSSSGVAVHVSVTQTTDAEKRYTSTYASVDPYAPYFG